MTTTTNTPRTDSCPHCGAAKLTGIIAMRAWKCGNANTLERSRSELCRERERHQDALLRYSEELNASKAEVERLHAKNEKLSEDLNRVDALVRQSDLMWRQSEAEVERLKGQYEAAADSVARMHEAAVGEIRGPFTSVLEDIKAVRERAEKAEAKANKLESSLRRIIDAPVFDPAKLIDFSMKLLWDSIAEAKATINQDNK